MTRPIAATLTTQLDAPEGEATGDVDLVGLVATAAATGVVSPQGSRSIKLSSPTVGAAPAASQALPAARKKATR